MPKHRSDHAPAAAPRNCRVYAYNLTTATPAGAGSIASKITSTQTAFEVASDALQIFGGNGLTHEYPIEKILRDARASMIEDGATRYLPSVAGACW